MKSTLIVFAVSGLILSLSACSDKSAVSESAQTKPSTVVAAEKPASSTKSPSTAEPVPTTVDTKQENGILQLTWNHLTPQGADVETMMAKYQGQITQVAKDSPEEKALLHTIMDDFSKAPTNPALAGKRIQIAGYVSPLAEKDGQISEFLLVPYIGSSLDMPPPPANQIIWVKPQVGQSIAVSDMYQPVSVIGDLKVGSLVTDAAKAGYQLENAEVQPYSESSLPGVEELDEEIASPESEEDAPATEQVPAETKP